MDEEIDSHEYINSTIQKFIQQSQHINIFRFLLTDKIWNGKWISPKDLCAYRHSCLLTVSLLYSPSFF